MTGQIDSFIIESGGAWWTVVRSGGDALPWFMLCWN